MMVTFNVTSMSNNLRQGSLDFDGIRLPTPLAVPSIAILNFLSSDQLDQLGVNALFFDPVRITMGMSKDLSNLSQLLCVHQPLVATSGSETAYHLAKPRGRKKTGVNFHRPDNDQLVHYTPESAQRLQFRLGARLGEQLSRNENYYAPVDDLVAATEQTEEWLQTISSNTPLLAPVVGGGLKKLRTQCIAAVPKNAIGYSIKQLAEISDQAELRRILQQVMPQLDSTELRVAKVGDSPTSIMTALSTGIDVVQSDAALEAARHGYAWNGDHQLLLTDSYFANDTRPLGDGCSCPTCRGGYSRRSIHYLLVLSAPLGIILLLKHNLVTLHHAVHELRQAIANDRVPTWVESYHG